MIFLQLFAGGTDIEVALWIEGEVGSREKVPSVRSDLSISFNGLEQLNAGDRSHETGRGGSWRRSNDREPRRRAPIDRTSGTPD